MSTRQLLNMALGAVALLLAAAATLVWNQDHSSQVTAQQIEVAQQEQVVIQDLGRRITALQNAENQASVAVARRTVGRTVLKFDRNLAVLAKGGVLTADDGREITISRIRGGRARQALEEALQTWRTIGTPLANMAAGEYSIYSAAGQDAVHGLADNTVVLMEQMGSIANSLRAGALARQAIARLATWSMGVFAVMLAVLIWLRVRVDKLDRPGATPQTAPREQAVHLADALAPAGDRTRPPSRALTPTSSRRKPPAAAPQSSGQPAFKPPVDLETVNATVDSMTVNMDTIAGRTEKMRLAIDSVGGALQGMLDSLNEMAQDTTEGYKIVKGANNAASFTAQTAEELVASAANMVRIVDRVTQLALKTREVAAQIDADALTTGQPGEAFTSVVATEVKGLARQTSQATLEIENTVASILSTSRQFEEAIGQIIQNVSAINKVSEHLGELMLSPESHPVPASAPLAPSAAAEPSVPEAEQPMPAVPEPPAGAPDPFVQVSPPETDPEPASEPGADFASKPAFSLDEDQEEPIPSLEEVAQETKDVIQELGLDIPEPEAEAPTATDTPTAELVAETVTAGATEPEPAPAPEAPIPVAETPAEEIPAEEAPTPPQAPAAEDPTTVTAPQTGQNVTGDIPEPVGSNGNVFLLKKPATPLPVERVPETVPADPDRPTIMRLSKSPEKE